MQTCAAAKLRGKWNEARASELHPFPLIVTNSPHPQPPLPCNYLRITCKLLIIIINKNYSDHNYSLSVIRRKKFCHNICSVPPERNRTEHKKRMSSSPEDCGFSLKLLLTSFTGNRRQETRKARISNNNNNTESVVSAKSDSTALQTMDANDWYGPCTGIIHHTMLTNYKYK